MLQSSQDSQSDSEEINVFAIIQRIALNIQRLSVTKLVKQNLHTTYPIMPILLQTCNLKTLLT